MEYDYHYMSQQCISNGEINKEKYNSLNWWRHNGHLYSVKTQNGLNQALYDFFNATDDGDNCTHSKEHVRKMVQNFPRRYPVSFVIVDQSFECERVYLEFFDLKEMANGDCPFLL